MMESFLQESAYTENKRFESKAKRQINDLVNILLVDDLSANLLALEALLIRDGVVIFKANSGTKALELLMAHEFAVAIVDVKMPEMSGFELATLMRGTLRTKSIPIIFVTATAKKQSFSFEGYESGAVDFLLKPLDAHAVTSKVNIFIEYFQSQRELKSLLSKFEATQIELEGAVRIRDDFMAIASHELKTPLTTLMLHAQLRLRTLEKGDLTAFSEERLKKMFVTDYRHLDRISRLIDSMLDVSRIKAGKLGLTLEQLDLCELVQDVCERTSDHFKAAGCAIEISACVPVLGHWDRFRIEQVVTNLLTNAMRYGAGKPIVIQVSAVAGKAQLVVTDSGRGIAKENQARIFSKFERAVSSSEVSGLGLGLHIVSEILLAHEGTVRVVSNLGEGATFVVELPL